MCATPTESHCYHVLSWRQLRSLLSPFYHDASTSSPLHFPARYPADVWLPPFTSPVQSDVVWRSSPLPPHVLSHRGTVVAPTSPAPDPDAVRRSPYLPGTIRCRAVSLLAPPTCDSDGARSSPTTSPRHH
jgi:hypothetical protein